MLQEHIKRDNAAESVREAQEKIESAKEKFFGVSNAKQVFAQAAAD